MLKLSKFEIGILIHCIVPQKLSLKTIYILNNIFKNLKMLFLVRWNKQKRKVQKYSEKCHGYFFQDVFSFLSLEYPRKGKCKQD